MIPKSWNRFSDKIIRKKKSSGAEPHGCGSEGLVGRLLDAAEHDPADHRDDDGRHAGDDECFHGIGPCPRRPIAYDYTRYGTGASAVKIRCRSEEHTSELQSLRHLVCRL